MILTQGVLHRHYSNATPQEAAAVITDQSQGVVAPSTWPAQGAIVFKDVKMRYRPTTPLVLKGISLSVRPMEKIGICGRSGCGKSSLLKCLFRCGNGARCVQLARTSGL